MRLVAGERRLRACQFLKDLTEFEKAKAIGLP
jgi:hypothetical protein